MLTFRQFVLKEELITPAKSLGLSREEMPQISSYDVPDFLRFLKTHLVTSQKERVPATDLKPTQKEINGDRVSDMKASDADEKPMLVSQDGYILDGHHRWLRAAFDKALLNIIRISLNILPLIELAKKFPKVFYKTLAHKAAA